MLLKTACKILVTEKMKHMQIQYFKDLPLSPDVGGLRIEDIVEVTKAGCSNLTKMEIQLKF
jgi:Xaa-Pro aminopeptidase